MKFYKYQGTGNDFIILNNIDQSFNTADKATIANLCNRRFGIGADGLILLQKHSDGTFYMQYFNSDGGESSMCGNGGRCFAQFIFDLGLAQQSVSFKAIDGWHAAHQMRNEDGLDWIALQMISVETIKKLPENTFELNTGSPHYVSFLPEPIAQIPLNEWAKKIRFSPPYNDEGINVNFVNILGLKDLRMRTYERGVEDETYSCGTGAVAAALSAALFAGLPSGKHTTQVAVPGGDLAIQYFFNQETKSFSDVWLLGPAAQVFVGEIRQENN
jgi:diaminopimelate epimerase